MASDTSFNPGETTEDAVLGGRLVLRQPRRGHRFGHDAILLAAAVDAGAGQAAVDLGAGVGAAGLALARRVGDVAVTLVEIDPVLSALSHENALRNGLAERVRTVCFDVTSPPAAFAAAGLALSSADRVLMNPPFNAPQNPSPDPARRQAHVASDETLARWLDAAALLLRAGGEMTLIWRADALSDVLAAVERGFGAVTVLPIYPRPGAPAIRIIVRAKKGESRPPVTRPGLVLAEVDGTPSADAEAVLRHGSALNLAIG